MRHLLLLAAIACGNDPPAEPTTVPEEARPPLRGDLLISELYTSGAVPAGGTDHYFSDQFIELVNVSTAPLDLSGVLVGDAYGVAGPINPGTAPDSFAAELPDQVVLANLWAIPDDVFLEPGEQLVIAQDGTNHRPFSTIDLSGAALESYHARGGGDTDHPTVANLDKIVFNGGYDWLMTVFGPSVVVLAAGTDHDTIDGAYSKLASLPADAVLDGIDTLMDADSGGFKRLPDSVDAGFATIGDIYVGRSLHRKRAGDAWQDTDDSSADFEPGEPDPWQPPSSGAVTGDAWLELGTGTTSYVALADGDPVELVAGPQGGWHVDTTLRFGGFGPDGVVLVYEAVDTSATRVSYTTSASVSAASVEEDGEGWLRLGDRIVMDITAPGEVVGAELYLRVTAEVGGQTFSDERRVLVVDEQ